jgi:hypothetical protein
MGVTIGEQTMWAHIGQIAQNLNRIANCMEADEKRKREFQTWNQDELAGNCSHEGCLQPVIVAVNNARYCEKHMQEAFATLARARESIRIALYGMEQAVEEGK